MGLFLLSLESGFFVLCSCQIDQCLISILLWYLSLSESGGKDKTMMMNMMTGAVAINGGVGVMEVRSRSRRKRYRTQDISPPYRGERTHYLT